MKKMGVLLVVVAITIGAWLVFTHSNHVTPPAPAENPATIVSSNNSSSSGVISATPAVPEAVPLLSTQTAAAFAATSAPPIPLPTMISPLPPLTVLDNARVVMHNYATTFGENPVGDNSEITAALMGKNPKQVNFISEESGLRVNGQGELIDAWGTPFFFHQLSSKLMEIHSAGEDRKMWTLDDQVTR